MSQVSDGPVSFAEISVGQTVAPATFVADRDVVNRFVRATGGDLVDPRYVPSALAAVYGRAATMQLQPPPGGIFAGQRFRFERPIRVGESLTTSGEVVEAFEKASNRFVVMRSTTRDSQGSVVTTGWSTRIWSA